MPSFGPGPLDALRARAIPTRDVTSRVRLTKGPDQYLAVREGRRELTYEALLNAGRRKWSVGDRIRVYRGQGGAARLFADPHDDDAPDPRDYDVEHYVRLLGDTFASRLARAFRPEDYDVVIEPADQLTLFARSIGEVRATLREVRG